jgi:hypothetical protein
MARAIFVAIALTLTGAAQSAPAAECFPFERLPAALRPKAEAMLLRALDGEALYTIAGGLKPMSSGVYSGSIKIDAPDLAAADETRQILQAWTCGGEIAAGLHHFAAVFQGSRALEAVVFHTPTLRRLLTTRAAFFAPYGLSASSDPMEVVMAVEYDPTVARLRGYGYLFGYPDYAVDFFAAAAQQQKDEEAQLAKEGKTGKATLVPRDFISLPTQRGENRFVYAAPKGHVANAADVALRAATEAIFTEYSTRRAKHITGDSASGVLTLVRQWFDDGTGNVRPSHARRPS